MINNPIFTHRSIRKYKPDPIPEGILARILEAGSRASTTGNMQVYSMIVTTTPEIKEKLWQVHFRQDMVKQAPVVITFCADFNRFNKWCRLRKAEPGYDNYLSFFTAAIDALLASQNVALEAENNGLGICYLGTTTYNAPEISEILNLPAGVVPVTTLVTGYPDENPPLTDRLPMEAIVHQEVYQDFTPEKIDRIYSERENSAFTKDLLEINQKETLAQIFTDKRYTKKDNEFFSGKFLEFIKRQGFQ
jgi:FMN reductase (NADPH)